jgi:hypothetical protein
MRLEGADRRALHAAMLEVFADFDALAVFTRLHLDLPLATVTERTATPAAILRLIEIEHAEAVGLMQPLVAQLATTYGGNASIDAVAARHNAAAASSAPPRAPSVAVSSTPPAPGTLHASSLPMIDTCFPVCVTTILVRGTHRPGSKEHAARPCHPPPRFLGACGLLVSPRLPV